MPAPAGLHPAARGQHAAYLDALDERLMFRAAYRNLGDHEALVVNHTWVAVTGPPGGPIRWYEVRGLAGSPSIFQQGTFAPNDGVTGGWEAPPWTGRAHRGWLLGVERHLGPPGDPLRRAPGLGSARPAQPGRGDADRGLGGSQTDSASRWGSYAAMSVDPTDDCTFWFTSEYYASTSGRGCTPASGTSRSRAATSPMAVGGRLERDDDRGRGPRVLLELSSAGEHGHGPVRHARRGPPRPAPTSSPYGGRGVRAGGPASQEVVVATVDDAAFEGTESVFLDLTGVSGGGAWLRDPQGLGVIVDDEEGPDRVPRVPERHPGTRYGRPPGAMTLPRPPAPT